MLIPSRFHSRREFLQVAGLAIPACLLAEETPRSRPAPRVKPAARKIAVVASAYHYLSHAYHICGRFLYGYLRGGKMHYPDFAIAGMYVEQQKANDLSKELSKKH